MKRILICMLIFTLAIQTLLTVGSESVQAEVCPVWEYDTDGSTILIDSALELSCIRTKLDGNYKLTANIDLKDYFYDSEGWKPIGDSTTAFSGTLSGNGYVIRNMTINSTTPNTQLGLFRRVSGINAKLENIRLLDINVSGNGNNAPAGGLVGNLISGKIQNSYAAGSISVNGTDSAAGGLIGVNAGGTIQNSYALVNVGGPRRVGGLVGTNAGTIKDSFSTGKVSADLEVGGLVGYNTNATGTIQNSYAAGHVKGNSIIGGLVGRLDGGGTITNSYWNKETTGQSTSAGGGTGLMTEEMKDPNKFSGWDTSVWGLSEGETYPYLRAFHMGNGINPIASTYNLGPGQNALSVTESVYHEASGEPITVNYVIRNSSNVTVTSATYVITSEGGNAQTVKSRFSLSGWSDDTYTLSISAADTRNSIVGATLVFKVDKAASPPPSVSLEPNGSEGWSQSASSEVSVMDIGHGVDEDSLKYAWSTDTVTPVSGWTSFVDGQQLSKNGVDGDWYLHIRAKDDSGNPANVVSNRFRLDIKSPTLSIAQIPASSELTSAPVTITVDSDGTGSEIAEKKWANGLQPAGFFASGGTLLTGSSFQVAANGAYTVYVRDQAGNEAIGTIDVHNRITELPQIELTYSPTTSIGGSVAVHVDTTVAEAGLGNTLTKLNWLSGSHNAADFAGGANGTDILASKTFAVTANGTYTVYAKDAAGNEAVEMVAISNIVAPSSGGSGSFVTTPTIDQNGISLDPDKIDVTKQSVTIDVTPKDGTAYVSIPASILKRFEAKNDAFVIEIKTPYGSYQVPVHLASLIPGLTDLLAKTNLKIEDISFKITLTDKSNNKDIQSAFATGLPGGKVMGSIVDFHIEIINAKSGQSIGSADQFSQTLTRVIPMPKNITSMPEQWGAFRFNGTTKKFEFVPARKVQIDGVWFVMISSYSNSVYVVAENAVHFKDTQKHWSQSFVELAAARGLVEGVGGGLYDPERAVTRAEFTAMLVRALGRGTAGSSTTTYEDVQPGAWYFDVVSTAKELGLLDFASGTSFKPDQPLTREEMASMLAAATVLEKLPMTKEFVSLERYKDKGSVNPAYLEAVSLMVKLNIMNGTADDAFSPKGETTRAQAATVFVRTLQKLGMIDG